MSVWGTRNSRGFTLVEVAIALVIAGLVAGGGLLLLKWRAENRLRGETLASMLEAREALLTFARVNGRLPWPDSVAEGDGRQNPGYSQGLIPYADLGVKPTDAWGNYLVYNSKLFLDDPARSVYVCNTMMKQAVSLFGYTSHRDWRPSVVDGEGSDPFNVAAVILSPGVRDADGDGWLYDIAPGGDNRTESSPYIRSRQTDTFDDLLVYISYADLYDSLGCDNLGPSTP